MSVIGGSGCIVARVETGRFSAWKNRYNQLLYNLYYIAAYTFML